MTDAKHEQSALSQAGELATPFLTRLKNIWTPSLNDKAGPTAVLYHYTTAQAQVGIINDRTLWFTDVRYLNDASEILYGVSLMHGVVKKIRRRVNSPPVDAFCDLLSASCRFVSDGPIEGLNQRAFVACFTEKDDDLYQWRAYGGQTWVCDRLPGRQLSERVARVGKTVLLQKVEYSRNSQEASFKRVMDESIEGFIQLWETYKDHEYYDYIMIWILMWLRVHVAALALKFKNSAFETEKEWRLIQHGYDRDTEVEFRSGRMGLIPFVKIKPDEELPIARIVIGPRVNKEVSALEEKAVRDLLRRMGYKNKIGVVRSSVSIRY